ncbi:MAG: hypothetical protein IPG89_21560 [Bacteroidetes bacterium]|nr:hypothetical protein [Bacteroidota bacterium]
MRSLEKQVHLGEISYSRMIEIINEKADTLLSDKLLLAYCEIDELTKEVEHKNHTIENDAIHIETLTKEVERLRNLNKRLFTLWRIYTKL